MGVTEETTSISALAQELLAAHDAGKAVAVQPSARERAFNLDAAYDVENEIVRLRQQAGHQIRGLKVGFANRAMLRAMKLDTVLWAHMYDDTVQYAAGGLGELKLPPCNAPKIEPEIVFAWKDPIETEGLSAAEALRHVEWLALGFEIIDCPFPDWKFQPADFVADLGLHRALIVGDPLPVTEELIPTLVDQLANFTLRLSRNGELVEEGAGRNSLRSPALCLAELGSALLKRQSARPAAPGDLVSSGTLTAGQSIATGELWRAEVLGLAVKPIELRLL